ncbi:hypothetical protein, partial [Roseibium sp. RKSG952]|uniref:hypothetical protein n=1 Tax=Roseibium sp. RKSG952 TaxID=2529384 RepID=UPI001AD9015F
MKYKVFTLAITLSQFVWMDTALSQGVDVGMHFLNTCATDNQIRTNQVQLNLVTGNPPQNLPQPFVLYRSHSKTRI